MFFLIVERQVQEGQQVQDEQLALLVQQVF
jgi:hypothetical protein